MKHDPIMLFREVLRCGDDAFAGLLVGILRADPVLRERADHELHELPRLLGAPAPSTPRQRAIAERLKLNGNSA